MFELGHHIEVLLLDHDCVIVPGFGGFVAHNTPAQWDEEESIFLPPSRTIGFNSQLTINDGLLAQSYMRVYDTNFPDANRILENQILALTETLHEEGKVEIPNVGYIAYSAEDSYSFHSYDHKIASPLLYGLDSFEMLDLKSLPELSQPEKSKTPSSTKEEEKTKGRSIIYNVASVAAVSIIAVFLFFMSTPIENTYIEKGNYAKILSSEMLDQLDKSSLLTTYIETGNLFSAEKEENLPLQTEEKQIEEKENIEEKTLTENVDSIETVVPEVIDVTPTPPVQPAVRATASQPRNKYNLIVASGLSEKEAQRQVERLKTQGYEGAKLIKRDGKIRVSIMSLPTREEAESQLLKIRKDSNYQNAWLLTR